jgi:ATP-binding protein involved in chromosome partitioning
MSMYTCVKCGEGNHIFGRDGVVDAAKRLVLDILADVPLHSDICRLSDEGRPIVVADPEGVHAKVYLELARKIKDKLVQQSVSNN